MGAVLTRQTLRRIAIIWIICLTAGSLQPYRPPGEPHTIRHRIAHVISFGTAALMLLALGTDGKSESMGALAVLCLAVVIETGQHLLYKNSFEWWDVRDDTIGILIAALLIHRTRVRSWLLTG